MRGATAVCLRWILVTLALTLPALATASLWRDLPAPALAAKGMAPATVYYRLLQADKPALRQRLLMAP
ncbi:MAG: hypothetical protein B6D74_07150, partial [gamma proteobacterium symbiont of Ctena orbiculata]